VRLTPIASIAAEMPCLRANPPRYETPDIVPNLSASECAQEERRGASLARCLDAHVCDSPRVPRAIASTIERTSCNG
jgi:hypothetical protein